MTDATDMTRTMKRRGILAAAGAVVAGIVAKQAARPVMAAALNVVYSNDPGTVFFNGPASQVELIGQTPFGNAQVFYVESNSSTVDAIVGKALNGRNGVIGQAASGIGVYGTSVSGVGARGEILNTSNAANTIGVFGNNLSTGANGIGVYGSCASGTGIYGQTSASNQYGILGTTYATSSTAIAGTCTGNGSSAFSGGTTNPNAYAGVFQGNVVIQGRLVVSDPSYKSGALAHPDGSTRLVYCVESPESWIEDVGTGTLTNGTASVKFDPDFAAVTHTDSYHVFLTEYTETQGVFVSNRSASGFTVQERNKGTTSGTFSWKVMVKAKSSVKSERLGKFTMPKFALPDVSKFKAPEVPAVPAKKP